MYVDKLCHEKLITYDYNYLSTINYLIQNKLSIFGEKHFNNSYITSEITFNQFNNLEKISSKGEITSINTIDVRDKSQIILEEELVQINGWHANDLEIDNVIITSNNELIAIYTDFPIPPRIMDIDSTKSNWSIILLSGYFPDGCNSIVVSIIDNAHKYNFENKASLCKN